MWAQRVYKSFGLCRRRFQFNFIASSSCRPVAHSFAEAKKQLKCRPQGGRKCIPQVFPLPLPPTVACRIVAQSFRQVPPEPPHVGPVQSKMKADNFNLKYGAPLYQPKSSSSRSHSQNQPQAHIGNIGHLTTSSLLTSDDLRHLAQQRSTGYSDRESIASVSSAGGRIKRRSR